MEIKTVEPEYKSKLFQSEDTGADCLWQVLTAVSAVTIFVFGQTGLENLFGKPGLILCAESQTKGLLGSLSI